MKKILLSALCFHILLTQESRFIVKSEKTQDNLASTIEFKSGFILGIEATFGEILMREQNAEHFNTMVMGGLLVGYQHYITREFGIITLATIHDSTSANIHTQSVLPFWMGAEFDILWDYFQKGQHTLGLNVGLGYNVEIYHNYQITLNGISHPLPFFLQHNLYPIFALHYYYNKHQIQLGYRFVETLKFPTHSIHFKDQILNPHISYTNYLNLTYFYRF